MSALRLIRILNGPAALTFLYRGGCPGPRSQKIDGGGLLIEGSFR